jgi:hypothetical protein
MSSFRDMPGLMRLPRWLTAFASSRVLYTAGLVLDGITELARESVMARFPNATLQPDALPYLGRGRDLERGPNEPADNFATRITQAFDTYATIGHPRELLANLAPYLLPNTPILRAIGDLSVWDTLSSGVDSLVYGSANWNWDGRTQWWRAWAVIFTPSFGPAKTYGASSARPFKYGDGTVYGSGATTADVRALRNVVKKWKGGANQVINVIVSQNSALFDPTQPAGGGVNPDGLFGRPYKSTGSGVVKTRFSGVAYFDGAD